MVNCPICGEPDAQLRVCEKTPSHLVHTKCLQTMLDNVGADISQLICPSCPSGELLSLKLILDYQNLGISLKNTAELVIEYSKRKVLVNLLPNEMIV
jgi:hypothetical protein